jgi:hypothetical protein
MCDKITIICLRAPNNMDSYRNAPAVMQFLTQWDHIIYIIESGKMLLEC